MDGRICQPAEAIATGDLSIGLGQQAPRARQIKDQRYARGKVSREEYELTKQNILDGQV